MIQIQRLTEDSSWFLKWDELLLIIDPWLIGSEIDGASWINKQWHRIPPVEIEQLPNYDAILVSQSYEDHCHLETLRLLDSSKPILAVPKAFKKVKKKLPERSLILLEEHQQKSFSGINFTCFIPEKILDPIYYAVLISNSKKEGIFYSPHGFSLSNDDLNLVNQFDIKLLITTFTEFDLPGILGGKVNPGMNNVRALHKQLNPTAVLNTHDEEKIMEGLVAKTGHIRYADYEKLQKDQELNFTYIQGYEPVDFH